MIFICATGQCVNSNEHPLLSPARALVSGIETHKIHARYANDMRENGILDENGNHTYCFNCYGFIYWLLEQNAAKALEELRLIYAEFLPDVPASPDAKITPYTYYKIAQTKHAFTYWNVISSLADMKPGDLLIYIPIGYTLSDIPPPPGTKHGTHVMMVDQLARNDDGFTISVIDSTQRLHNKYDARYSAGGIGKSTNIKITAGAEPGQMTLQWSEQGEIHHKLFAILRLKSQKE